MALGAFEEPLGSEGDEPDPDPLVVAGSCKDQARLLLQGVVWVEHGSVHVGRMQQLAQKVHGVILSVIKLVRIVNFFVC